MKSKTRRSKRARRGKVERGQVRTGHSRKVKAVRLDAFLPSERKRATEPGEIIEMVPMVLKVRNILVPIDFSPPSEKALSYARAFAKQFDARITLLHVIEPSVYPKEFGYGSADDRAWVKAATDRLQALASRKLELAFLARVLVGRGPPFKVIASMSQDLEIDLIIIATHGYSGLKHVLIGSTAERVVRHAQCPVLVVREREHEFVQG